jgi:hypothetical protein
MSKNPYWHYWELLMLHIAFKLIEFRNKHTTKEYVKFKVITNHDLDKVCRDMHYDLGIFTTHFTRDALRIRWEITKRNE